ncbi:STAS domain-containing protein [Rugamonas sp.]|uniref:STAS domain-containing protein n=1 Tax=Rugamonas sp. TaxID=1926287 RepID=UPI0025FB4452|nr:STAS domain-containing protein [Rugamonas sp.]
MGLFSIFKKTGATPTEPVPTPPEESARLDANSELARLNTQALQRDIARATAMKIDAIESAMAFDIFNTPEPAWGSRPPRPAKPAESAPAATDESAEAPPDTVAAADDDGNADADDPATLPLIDEATTELLDEEDLPLSTVMAESASVVEEIAVLYASGQQAVAEQMLVANLPACGGQDRTIWWMLFDLYQIGGRQDAFDNLSIDYASCFETSPPAWNAVAAAEAPADSYSGVAPTEAFAGVLDGAIAPQLERLRQLAAGSPVLRLEFNRITSVEPDGCALLLAALQSLQRQQRELIVVAAAELVELIRPIIAVGRRDEGAAPWLLLLELLQLLNREKDFEESGMDYCVTFEVSPPSFVAPQKVAMAARQHVSASPDRFMLPPVIEGNLDTLLAAIGDYAAQYPAMVFDCSRLSRLELGAANQLLAQLQTLAAGRRLEFRDVNHLVTALLRLLGYAELARIYPHKY